MNLISITQLEKDGYLIYYNNNRDWVVTTLECKTIMFQKDVGMCKVHNTLLIDQEIS